MVGYTTFGTNDLERAIAFYDELLGEFGAKQIMNTGRLILYGREMGAGIGRPVHERTTLYTPR